MTLESRNPVRLADGRIDCEVNHPAHGWVPFTADPNDIEEAGRLVFEALDGQPMPDAPPPPAPPKRRISKYTIVTRVAGLDFLPQAIVALNHPANAALRMLYDALPSFNFDDIPMREILAGIGLTEQQVEFVMSEDDLVDL